MLGSACTCTYMYLQLLLSRDIIEWQGWRQKAYRSSLCTYRSSLCTYRSSLVLTTIACVLTAVAYVLTAVSCAHPTVACAHPTVACALTAVACVLTAVSCVQVALVVVVTRHAVTVINWNNRVDFLKNKSMLWLVFLRYVFARHQCESCVHVHVGLG